MSYIVRESPGVEENEEEKEEEEAGERGEKR